MSNVTYNTDLCRCCHSEGQFKHLYEPYIWLFKEEVVYADLLRECFAIELFPVTEPNHQMACAICDDCIEQLQGAMHFKRQVMKCEKQFRDLYSQHVIGDFSIEVEITPEINFHAENVSEADDKSPTKDDQESKKISDDRFDNDMGVLSDHEEAVFSKLREEENKKANPSKRRAEASKRAKSSKKVKTMKEPEPPKDEDVVEVLEGGIKVVKHRPGTVRLQEGVDYKLVGDLAQCCRCEKKLTSDSIKSHIKHVHLNIPRFTCIVCSQLFNTRCSLRKHKFQEHNIDTRIKCNACDKVFLTKAKLKHHTDSFHMLGKKYKCDLCSYESYISYDLRRHKKNHKAGRDFNCKYCGKGFKRKSTMRLHEKIHTGDRTKVCKLCGEAFVQKASLNYHLTKYHPVSDA